MRIFVVMISVLFVGCGTPKMGLWKHQSGGEVYTTDKSQDTAIVKTEFGVIKIQPYSLNDAYGFVVKVWIENSSDKSVSYKYSDFKIQNQSGEMYDPLDEESIKAAVEGSVSNAALIAGGSYGMQTGVTANIWRQIKSQMLLNGEVPSKATKSGAIYFAKQAASGVITFRFGNLLKQEVPVKFGGR